MTQQQIIGQEIARALEERMEKMQWNERDLLSFFYITTLRLASGEDLKAAITSTEFNIITFKALSQKIKT